MKIYDRLKVPDVNQSILSSVRRLVDAKNVFDFNFEVIYLVVSNKCVLYNDITFILALMLRKMGRVKNNSIASLIFPLMVIHFNCK